LGFEQDLSEGFGGGFVAGGVGSEGGEANHFVGIGPEVCVVEGVLMSLSDVLVLNSIGRGAERRDWMKQYGSIQLARQGQAWNRW
jgi:hypothetical protein